MKVGIDPGLGGAIAFVTDNSIELYDMPTIEIPWAVSTKYKTMVDAVSLAELISNYKNEIETITIEIVGVRPAQGISSNAVLVSALHTAITVVKLLGFEPIMVHPGKWKRKWGLINMDKDMARLVALKMYPFLLPQLKRKKDVDRAEALLIAMS